VATNPSVKIKDKETGEYFNYVRPLMTLSTLSAGLNYPVWTPYGYNQSDLLVRDLLFDRAFALKPDGTPIRVFIAWQHENIEKLYGHLIDIGRLESLAGKSMTVADRKFKCETAPFWNHCDFDSIWLTNARNNSVCLLSRGPDKSSRQE
jgi:hypothetical protein